MVIYIFRDTVRCGGRYKPLHPGLAHHAAANFSVDAFCEKQPADAGVAFTHQAGRPLP